MGGGRERRGTGREGGKRKEGEEGGEEGKGKGRGKGEGRKGKGGGPGCAPNFEILATPLDERKLLFYRKISLSKNVILRTLMYLPGV